MSARRICLISPGHLSTNPRLVKEARTLTEAGYDVRVVHGRYATWAQQFDLEISDPRWRTVSVAFGPFEAPPRSYLAQTLRRRVARAFVRLGGNGDKMIEDAHAPAVPGLRKAALENSADLYIAHYVAALPAAARAAQRHGAQYAFDAEDFHLGDAPEGLGYDLEKRIIRSIESRYLPGAAFVTAAAPMIADAYAEAYSIPRPTVVLNAFPRAGGPASWGPKGSALPRPSMYWFSQTIGPDRGLEAAIEAIARASSSPHLYLRGSPSTGYEQQLRTLAAHHGVVDKLHFLPLGAPSEMERLGAQYDVGYAGETGLSRNRACALTNKLFSYLSSGIPILASNIPSHRLIAADLGGAMTLFDLGDIGALASAIDGLLLHPARLSAARELAWQLGRGRYCWEAEQTTLLNVVQEAFAAPSID